jgi:hypothetical protein
MAIMAMLPQIEVERDIPKLLFLRGMAQFVKKPRRTLRDTNRRVLVPSKIREWARSKRKRTGVYAGEVSYV